MHLDFSIVSNPYQGLIHDEGFFPTPIYLRNPFFGLAPPPAVLTCLRFEKLLTEAFQLKQVILVGKARQEIRAVAVDVFSQLSLASPEQRRKHHVLRQNDDFHDHRWIHLHYRCIGVCVRVPGVAEGKAERESSYVCVYVCVSLPIYNVVAITV